MAFWSRARAAASRTAVIEADGSLVTAGELLDAANQLVHGLRAAGMTTGDVLVVCLGNRREFLEAYFAAMQAGWYFVPVSPKATSAELAHVLGDSAARALIFEPDRADVVTAALASAGLSPARAWSAGPAPGYASLAELTADQPTGDPPDRRSGEWMLYTSGTTGRPRAVVRPLPDITPEQRAERAPAHLGAMAGIEPDSGAIHIVASPLHHSASLIWCTDHLHLGHTVVLMQKWTPEGMLDCIERHRATGAFMVPTHFHRLLALPEAESRRRDVSSLRHVIHGGAPCPIEIKRRMLEWWGPVIYEVYGSTEGGGVGVSPAEWLARPGTVGKPAGGIRVLRDDGSRCDPGEPGVVYLGRVDAATFVYRNDPDKTAASRRHGLFTVGDVGYLDADGYLFLCDRQSDVIISGGVKVYPAEVESALLGHPGVADAVVFGIPDDEWGETVKAVVEPWPGVERGPALAAELTARCRAELAAWKCPRSIDFVDSLPRDATGKLSRRRVREPYWAGRGRTI